MFEQTASVIKRHFAQAAVFVAGKERLALFPNALVGVHAGAIVAKQRLGHESGGFAVLLGNVLDDVFVNHHPVGCGDERC